MIDGVNDDKIAGAHSDYCARCFADRPGGGRKLAEMTRKSCERCSEVPMFAIDQGTAAAAAIAAVRRSIGRRVQSTNRRPTSRVLSDGGNCDCGVFKVNGATMSVRFLPQVRSSARSD